MRFRGEFPGVGDGIVMWSILNVDYYDERTGSFIQSSS